MSPKELAKWKARGGAFPKVIGIHGPLPVDRTPMDPAKLEFKAKVKSRGHCGGCAFAGQSAAVCKEVGEQARLRGLEDCDAGLVYQLVERDARQIGILGDE